jgi:glycosyltransferase involved in cell wall biosynthesis
LLINKQAVILYNYNYINIFVNCLCKKRNIKTILIVADHSEYYEYHNPIRRFLAYKYSRDYYKFDYLIFLSKRLKDKYNLENSFLMVGGINNAKYKNILPTSIKDELIILYSGILSKVTGIDIYLKAIELIEDKEIRFVFSGKGEMEDFLIERSREDSRIEYIGFLEEKEYLLLLNKANVLINPRNMNLPQNQNNFPSKILEYLATGKVIISTKFPNYQEFEENIFFCEADPLSIANKIKFVIKNYDKKYKEIFIKNRKKAYKYDWYLQAKKIKLLIEG